MSTVTPPGVGDSAPKQMRNFKQILAEAKENRNILELKLTKLMVDQDGVMGKAKHISFEDVSVLIFDVIGVKPEHCLGVVCAYYSYRTFSADTRQTEKYQSQISQYFPLLTMCR